MRFFYIEYDIESQFLKHGFPPLLLPSISPAIKAYWEGATL